MRINQANYPIRRISEKALREKIDKMAQECLGLGEYPLCLFKNHVEEVKREVEARLLDSVSVTDLILRNQYYLYSWLSVWLLSDQMEKFTLVKASIRNPMWNQLDTIINDLVDRLELSSKPLPFFGSSFYCTGSFSYTERGITVSPFYQVSTESHESILFWPLLAHEVGHLKLKETTDVDSLRKELTKQNLRNEKYSERLDEALCDIMGVSLYGPAYVASFGTKFWQILDEYREESYPSNQFRLYIMLRTLEKSNAGPSIYHFKDKFEVDERLARREEISFLTDEMIELGQKLVRNPVDVEDEKIIDFCNNPSKITKDRLDYLFNVLWFMVYEGTRTFDVATDMGKTVLERWAKGSQSLTEG